MEYLWRWKMSKITLAEFLGWKEDTEYKYEGMVYKVIGTDLIVNVDGLYRWERVNDGDIKIHELGKLSEEAMRFEPKKYYLKHKFLGSLGYNFLNYFINGNDYIINDRCSGDSFKSEFTDMEIKKIEASGFDLCNFERVEV